ncbi:FadR/GntR family transcriptional regulator [Aureimonas pseudogalii]|uniref:GntR family transcriptional repressor for pyruvate dehydrogenase complex n=1 Tax=Aureimonas pseudogalii TaxID=1744844 RepID=A0A7W6MMA3_9HYPH|nr:FadR/GntR family transcriptional regulator [Aureimonas pseudogalii]MBB4000647.1 GntR family transcriptional repressor for pyruvate dehydrogenase complex [Aureimonas pseudogalii]
MSASLKPVDGRRLYQQVADQIRDLIRVGHFLPSDRLPAERDLALQIGVSRPSLREGLIALEIEGSVEIRMGSGVYVCARPPQADLSTKPMGESPSELMQARAAIEGSVVALAAARTTPEAIVELKLANEAMRSAIAAERSPLEPDRRFHRTIAELTGNSVMVRLVTELFDERHQPMSAQIQTRYESQQTWMSAVTEHAAIIRALEAAHPLLAQAAMQNHLEASRLRWIGP